jgi:chorismate lyase/3-hydroxybenzoate synthase
MRDESAQESARTVGMNTSLTRAASLPACPFAVAPVDTSNPGALFQPHTLAVVRFAETPGFGIEDSRLVRVRLAKPDRQPAHELWQSRRAVTTGVQHGVRYAADGINLFGWIHVAEPHLEELEEATWRTYTAILRSLSTLQYPHWLRVWNYLSAINEGLGDRERYRRFAVGRHRALAGIPGFERLLPAATAIGMQGDAGLRVSFLASRVPGIQIENPRQLNPFRYPRLYGPQSPSFSRAMLQHWHDRTVLYVSGTASITGHATQHTDDPVAQLDEALLNIEAVRQEARARAPGSTFAPSSLRLYARDAEVFSAIESHWRTHSFSVAPTILLLGELCRRDLLLEIEGVFEQPFPRHVRSLRAM